MSSISPHVTIWRNKHGREINAARQMDMAELERVIRAAGSRPTKDELPLLKLAAFGDMRSRKDSLRHDPNVTAIYGAVGDYDGEQLPMEAAAEMLAKHGVAAILYESPRATAERPRWRVIVPVSIPMEGSTEQLKQQHAHWMGVVNALLGGVLSGESFTLSQSYYFGRVDGTPERALIRLEGKCLDELEEIPAPIIKDTKINGHTAPGDEHGATLDGIATGEHIYNNTRNYSARLIAKGLDPAEALELLRGYLLGHRAAWESDGSQKERWQEVWDKLPAMIEGAVNKDYAPTVSGESAWPEPLDILSEFSAPELRPEILPDVLSEFPAAFAQSSGHDPTIALSAALGAASAALSDEFQIVADSATAWFQQSRLWIVAIGRPGAGKTPAQKAMLATLWAIHRELDRQWSESVKALADGESKPPKPRVIVADATIEALSEALRDNPRGLLLANDEFESWLGSLDAYRRSGASRDRGEWLRLFDGGPHTIERVQRGSVFVPNWGCGILTATTPSTLAKLTRELPEDGLLQRFLPFVARPIGEQRAVPGLDGLRERYTETITRLYTAAPRARNGCVSLSFQARDYFREWLKRARLTAEAFGSIEPGLESHLAKYPTFLLRITLVFHAAQIINQEAAQARDPAAFEVSLETIEQAAGFLKAARKHAIAVYVNRSGSDTYQLAREVARAILARSWKAVARRELIQAIRPFRAAESERQDAVLRLLVDIGWLRAAEGGYEKAIPARYAVNPLVPSRYAALAQRERERRAAIRESVLDAAEGRRTDRE